MSRTVTDPGRMGKANAMKDVLSFALDLQRRHEANRPPAERKARGQVFTPPEVCSFMAGCFTTFRSNFRLLDPGAGVGSLAVAVCDRVSRLWRPRRIEIDLYETDPLLAEPLRQVMERCGTELTQAGHDLEYRILREDFVLNNAHVGGQLPLFDESGERALYDGVILNPPYFKIAGHCEYAKLLSNVVHGQPNIYALFVAVAAQLLRADGEMVAITPRSFCSGPYFRHFRRWFLDRMSLRRLHLFESRTATFQDAGVLQESLITVAQKSVHRGRVVTVSTSHGPSDISRVPVLDVPVDKVVDDSARNLVVRIPCSPVDAEIIEAVESWPHCFAEQGLRISTGPVVSFRARRFLLDTPSGPHIVPLILVGNVRPFKTVWPLNKNGKPLGFLACRESRALLLKTGNYVLLRRFSAKEERRRLTASCFLKSSWRAKEVAFENHLNYIYHQDRELTDAEVYGIAALLNSRLLDRYFRTVSGNTQVNATEIRALHFPDLPVVSQIGRSIAGMGEPVQSEADRVVLETLGIDGRIARDLLEDSA